MFAFHARCEYLLASDLRTQRFALLATFSPQGRLEAIKVELRGEEVILYKTGNVICFQLFYSLILINFHQW